MAHQLRDVVCASRLAGRLSDSGDSDSEAAGVGEGGSASSVPEERKLQNGESAIAAAELNAARRSMRTPMPNEDSLESMLVTIDVAVVGALLAEAKTCLLQLSHLWSEPHRVFRLIRWWMQDSSPGTRKAIIDEQVQAVRDKLASALHVGVQEGSVTNADLSRMVRVVLREYPRRLHTAEGSALVLRYILLFGQSNSKGADAKKDKDVARTILSDIRCNTSSKKHIEWLLAFRVVSVATLCSGIVKVLARDPVAETHQGDLQPLKMADAAAFAAIDQQCCNVLAFLLGNDLGGSRAERDSSSHAIHCIIGHVEEDVQDVEGLTLAVYALVHKRNDALDYLIQTLSRSALETPCRETGNTVLAIACTIGQEGLVKSLLAAGVNCNMWNAMSEGTTPLHVAVLSNNLKCVKLLLDAGANVNAKMGLPATTTPLSMALTSCDARDAEPEEDAVYQLLISHGATE